MEATQQNIKSQSNNNSPRPATKLVVGIQYRFAGKVYTFETTEPELESGAAVMVEGEGGPSLGYVIVTPREVALEDLPKNIKKVLRRATPEELEKETARLEKSAELFQIFVKKVEVHQLPMKPLQADLVENGKKIIFSFFAEERVDFRALVKELASELHLRVEMRQIGARDEVKVQGGMGTCGLTTCCSTHLRSFRSISIQMAKTQGLMPNPAKYTGLCGKLKCCLAYENEQYAEIRKELPRLNSLVVVPQGEGKLVDFDILRRICVVRLEDGLEVKVKADDIKLRREKPKREEGKVEVKKDKTKGQTSDRKSKKRR